MNALFKTLILIPLVGAGLVACTGNGPSNIDVKPENVAAAFAPKPLDASTELAQLSRYRGQTSFLSYEGGWGGGGRGMPEAASDAKEAGGAAPAGGRAEQESDVFKVGAPGSKLLYLMNQYRGLQVVSFANGAEQPQLLGRAATSGASVDEMYSDLARQRLISIEHDYSWKNGKDESKSMLVAYDVKDPKAPKMEASVEIEGLVADSRIVGDVLYVVSRKGEKGVVASYSLKSADLDLVESKELVLPVTYEQNMNILTVDENGTTKYYLVAALSNQAWGWWRDASTVEVIDISDSKGSIKSLMSVGAKGHVRERSQTTIKNGTLIVTSNYEPKNGGQALPLRIAVETFKFPTTTSEVITEKEADYRRLHIERALQGKWGKDLEDTQEKLVNDAQLGLRGRFVRTANGSLRKLINDTQVTVGDGSGLPANLRDVRYQDGLLYAFWVPRDLMDPFDLFDMSQPEQGVKYLGRLHFDGWIERAIPMSYQGRKFVLGLGWIIPVVDAENGRRQPQAMIFEIKQVGTKLKSVEVAQFSLEGSNIWADFNGQDKMIEVRSTVDGKGEILFGASRYGQGNYESGGQIIKFDLDLAAQGAGEGLSAGPFLSGGADWVRRVFTNTRVVLCSWTRRA
ncbi:MAG: beta-propeller domain-containing protein, partial [Bdellovibrionota bacterium]